MTSPSRSLKAKRRPAKADDSTGARAAAAVRNWDLVRSRLAPVIGEDGFRILYSRSLHRARMEHPWLARGPMLADTPFSSLKASLAAESPESAGRGMRDLTTQFDALLHGLIGRELAARLLRDPNGPPPGRNQEIDR